MGGEGGGVAGSFRLALTGYRLWHLRCCCAGSIGLKGLLYHGQGWLLMCVHVRRYSFRTLFLSTGSGGKLNATWIPRHRPWTKGMSLTPDPTCYRLVGGTLRMHSYTV